jgi:cell wall assembly regulator SMI1
MSITFSGERGPLAPERVAQAEATMGVVFPADYREFMLAHNGGKPSRRAFVYAEETGPYTDGAVRKFYPIDSSDKLGLEATHHTFLGYDPPRMPRDVFPIADDSFGNQICICFSGPKCGYVYFWDHEHEAEDEPTYDNMHLVAKSFSEFLDKLTSSD